jgi:hypothetical protein
MTPQFLPRVPGRALAPTQKQPPFPIAPRRVLPFFVVSTVICLKNVPARTLRAVV